MQAFLNEQPIRGITGVEAGNVFRSSSSERRKESLNSICDELDRYGG